MQKNIILVVTKDPAFEKMALTAIMEMRHGMRKTDDPHEVWRMLALENPGIALAVIDVDLDLNPEPGRDRCGLFLLHILDHFEPAFPILAVTKDPDAAFLGQPATQTQAAIHYLTKPVTAATLRGKMQELCASEGAGKAS